MMICTFLQKTIRPYLCFLALATCSHLHGFMREGFQKPTPAIAQRKTSHNAQDVKVSQNNLMTKLCNTYYNACRSRAVNKK